MGLPVVPLKVPAAQSVQVEALAPEVCPTGQFEQMVSPVKLKCPAVQLVQVPGPLTPFAVPAEHRVQVEAAAADVAPVGQSVQMDAPFRL